MNISVIEEGHHDLLLKIICYNLKMNFLEFRNWFDERFFLLLKQKVEIFNSLSENVDAKVIVSYITTIAQEGKRFRPFLVYCASGIEHEDSNDIFLLLASVELLHIFALIHDDIMDEADTRHGVLCAHKKFTEQYGIATGEAIGILLGDIVFGWAYECLFEYTKKFPNFRDRVIEEFSRLVIEVTHGQLLDVLSPVQSLRSKKEIIEKMTLKTARYSFVQPLCLGFILCGDAPNDISFAESFGLPLGIGFQIQDDILDSESSNETGKTRFLDIQSGQQTLLSWYMQHEATIEEQKEFLDFFGKKDLPESTHNRLAQLLSSSGAMACVRAQSAQYFAEAKRVIQTQRAHDRFMWEEILTLVAERKK